MYIDTYIHVCPLHMCLKHKNKLHNQLMELQREEDSLIAAAYKLLPLWHQWPEAVESLAGLVEHAFWPQQGGQPAS